MNVSTRQLRAFVTLADCHSFAEASEALHLSQPALSMAIRKMEETVGGSLFSRSTRRLELSLGGLEVGFRLPAGAAAILQAPMQLILPDLELPHRRDIERPLPLRSGPGVQVGELARRVAFVLLGRAQRPFGVGDVAAARVDLALTVAEHAFEPETEHQTAASSSCTSSRSCVRLSVASACSSMGWVRNARTSSRWARAWSRTGSLPAA